MGLLYSSQIDVLAGSLECCKLLIEDFGAVPDLVDANGNTPAAYALEEGFEDVYEYLSALDSPNDHYVTEIASRR